MSAAGNPKARRTDGAGQRPGAGGPLVDPPIWETIEHAIDDVLTLPDAPASRWKRAGLSARGERVFERLSALVLVLFTVGWAWSIATAAQGPASGDPEEVAARDGALAASIGSRIASAITTPGTPVAAYLTDAALTALTPLRGESGRLRARFVPSGAEVPVDSLPAGAEVAIARDADTVTVADSSGTASGATTRPGIWGLILRAGSVVKPVADLRVITLVPLSARRNGRIGLYYIGSWPTEKGRAARTAKANYAPPRGFIEVTAQNQDTPVSDHFQLRDFLTKGQANVWPKYLVLDARLLDKLELVMADLQQRGIETKGVTVMSGFRTPSYNASGGNTAGRAEMSRHMYGDASDIFIDNDGNGVMDDLNRDGRVTPADVQVILAAVERVERAHPALVGGAGVYASGPGHGPFIHIDTRGYRARWVGSGD